MPDQPSVEAESCAASGASGRTFESFPNHEVKLGNLPVARALPLRGRRLVGPWCFFDRFGPLSFSSGKPMDVAPHPHIGIQTVTWLLNGEILHDDSLGCEAIAHPGGVNVMTAGRGIAHAEQTPRENTGILNGVQLWTALPNPHRDVSPHFQAVSEVPAIEQPGGVIQVFAGSLGGITSPARHYSEILGADLQIHAGESTAIGLDPNYEHAVLVLEGDCYLDGQPLLAGNLHYLGIHRTAATFRSRARGRVLLIGGPPFPEPILMWWNFVARTPEEMVQARADWEAPDHSRFGDVSAYRGPRLDAPPLARFARPNPLS